MPTTDFSVLLGGEGYEEARTVIETADAGFIAVGWTNSSSASEDGLAVKLDKDGQVEWQQDYGGEELDRFYGVVETDDGYVLAGRTRSFEKAQQAYVVKVDKAGNVLWEKSFGFREATGARSIK